MVEPRDVLVMKAGVHGTHGTLHVGWPGSRFRQDGSSSWLAFGTGDRRLDAFRNQLRNFVGWIRGTEAPLITTADALASVRVIEAAYAAARRDTWTPVSAARWIDVLAREERRSDVA